MTKHYLEIQIGGEWTQTAPMFLKHGDIVRCMKERHWLSREFLGNKFLAMTRWDYYGAPANRFMLTTMTDDGLEEMWP